MTVREIFIAVGRRWYIFVAVLLAFAAAAAGLQRDGGGYYTSTTVTFTLPARTTLLPDSGTNDLSVIAFAGAVATSVNEGKPVATYSSAQAPYYGAGVREGVMVSLRNDGNQWMTSFPNATLDIQIVGRTYDWVRERQTAILGDISDVAEGQQSATTTPAADRITATIAPLSTEITQIMPSRSSQLLALGAIALAGGIVAATVAVGVDRWLYRRRAPRVRPAGGPTPRIVNTGGSIA